MATYNKFQDFAEQIAKGVHNFAANVFNVALTNTLPVNTHVSLDTVTNHPAPAAANGYTAGGSETTITTNEASGTMTISGTQVVFTATGELGPFRYAILYNDSATSPADALIAWWDYGSSITLQDTETFTVKFNNTTPGTIMTIA